VDGVESGDLNHDDNAATIPAALEAMSNLSSGDVYCYDTGGLGTNDGYVTIVFINMVPEVSITMDLTGDDHTLSTVSAAIGEISLITANATPATDGTFTITVNGETTGNLDHDDSPADTQAALEALGGIGIGDVICFESGGGLDAASGVMHILFVGNLADTNPAVSVTLSLTGNDHVLSTLIAGASTYGTDVIQGFVWPDAITLAAANEVLGNVMLRGTVHYADIPCPSGETTTSLKAALRNGPRDKGLIVQGLDQVR